MQPLRTRLLAAGVAGGHRLPPLLHDAAAGPGPGRHRFVPGDRRRSPAGPAPGVSALLRPERRARPGAPSRGGTRREPGVGDRRRRGRRPHGHRRRRTGGHAGGRPRRRSAARGFLHVLVAGRHRRGLRASPASRERVSARPARLEGAALDSPPRAVLRTLRARLRQPPVDGAAPAGLRAAPGHGRPRRPAVDAAPARSGPGRRDGRPLRASVRLEHQVARRRTPERRLQRSRAHVLVRRDQVGLAHEHGLRDPDLDDRRSLRDVLVRRPPAVRDSRRRGRRRSDSPRCSGGSGASARCC